MAEEDFGVRFFVVDEAGNRVELQVQLAGPPTGFNICRRDDGTVYAEDIDGELLPPDVCEDLLDAFGFVGDMIREGDL